MSIESVMSCNHLTCCFPLLLRPSIFPRIRVFSTESVLSIRWTKYWNFSFSISPSNVYSGLISLRMDWLDLLAVQGTLKSLLPIPQFRSINSSAPSFLYSPTLLGRKVMTNLESILKRRDFTLPTKVRLVKAMVFPVVMYGM